MKDFLLRWGSVVLILFVLFAYQSRLAERTKDAEITALKQQVEQMQTEAGGMDAGVDGVQSTSICQDGTYEGVGEGFGGDIRIQLTITSGRIADIQVLSAEKEDSSYLSMAEGIIANIIDAQSAEVDTISGATYSSTGIRQAVMQALEQAEE